MEKNFLNPLFVKEELEKLKTNKIARVSCTLHLQNVWKNTTFCEQSDIMQHISCKGGGGGTSTTVVQPAPVSPEERELQRKQNMIVDEQIARQFDKKPDPKDSTKEILVLKPDLAKIDAMTRENILKDQEMIDLARAQAIKFLKGDISITGEQKALVEDTIQRTFVAPAERELTRFEQESAQALRESAARLGRGPLDPALIRDLTKEIAGRKTDILTRAGALRAGAEFELGTTGQMGRAQFGSELSRFQESLRQQAVENRFGLIGALQNQINTEQKRRQGAYTSTTTTSGGGGGGIFGSIMGGLQTAGQLAGIGYMIAGCLVAEELYGTAAYETSIAREIVRNSDHILTKLYTKYGYKIANFINNKPIIKQLIKPFFNSFIYLMSK